MFALRFISLIRCIVNILSKNNINTIAKTADNTDIMALLFLKNIQYVTSLECDVLASLLISYLLFGCINELDAPSVDLSLSK